MGFIDSVRVKSEGVAERAVFLGRCDVSLRFGDFSDWQLSCRRPRCHRGRVALCLPWHLVPLSSFIISIFLPFIGWFKYFLNHMLVFLGSSQLWGEGAGLRGPSSSPGEAGSVSVLLARRLGW